MAVNNQCSVHCSVSNILFIFEFLEWNMIHCSTLDTMIEIGSRKLLWNNLPVIKYRLQSAQQQKLLLGDYLIPHTFNTVISILNILIFYVSHKMHTGDGQVTHSSCTKNTSRHCKICATSLLSHLTNTVSLATFPGSTYPVNYHHNDSLAQLAVSRCWLLMLQILHLLDS